MAVGEYVTSVGLQIPTIEKITEDLATAQRGNMHANIDTEADSPIGQLNGIFGAALREAWEALAVAYNAFDPDSSEGILLDFLAAISGTKRAPATRSRFTGSRRLRVDLDANKTVVAGSATFHVLGDPSIRFVTTEDVPIDEPVHPAGVYYVSAECDQDGEIHANAGTLTVIATPVVGLNSVINEFDAVVGQPQDKDPALRLRRVAELRAIGSSTVDGIKSDVLSIELDDESKPVITCTVFENVEDVEDPDTGLPPHSLEVLVFDGIVANCPNNTLAQTIWDSKPGGIKTVGSSSGIAIDKKGNSHTVAFSRPTISEIKFEITLEIIATKYPGDVSTKAAIQAAFTANVTAGGKVRATDYIAALKALNGVVDVPNIQIARVGDPYPASHTNLELLLREMGNADSSNISITTV